MNLTLFVKERRYYVLLILIVLFGFLLRASHIHWDQGFYLHPDERALYMFTLPLSFPNNVQEFLSVDSPLNPHFFAYGSFPIYLLKAISVLAGSFYSGYSEYSEIYAVGRMMSAFFDSGVIVLVFLIASQLFNKKVAVASSFFYSVCVFAIQTSHFFTVDTYMVFFLMLSLLFLLSSFDKKKRYKYFIFSGIFLAFSLASKVNGVVLFVSIAFAAFFPFLKKLVHSLIFQRFYPPVLRRAFFESLFCFSLVVFVSFLFFILLQPYFVIDYDTFVGQLFEQQRMTKSAYVFPYTLQYVNKSPYLYELKNVFFWGLGPIASAFSFVGLLFFAYRLYSRNTSLHLPKGVVVFLFFLIYFLIVGRFAVGWMRYMLPLYPLFAIFAGLALVSIVDFLKKRSSFSVMNRLFLKVFLAFLLTFVLAWPLTFYHIYLASHPRVEASEWMHKNVPAGSVVAVEHWDDVLPLYESQKYIYETLPLYDRDTVLKWNSIQAQLENADYLVLSSNRLHGSLRRMRNCELFEEGFCYAQTAQYYDNLFEGKLSYRLIAEFHSFPKIPFTNIEINDQGADESFTVYDHPQVFIFQNIDSQM